MEEGFDWEGVVDVVVEKHGVDLVVVYETEDCGAEVAQVLLMETGGVGGGEGEGGYHELSEWELEGQGGECSLMGMYLLGFVVHHLVDAEFARVEAVVDVLDSCVRDEMFSFGAQEGLRRRTRVVCRVEVMIPFCDVYPSTKLHFPAVISPPSEGWNLDTSSPVHKNPES